MATQSQRNTFFLAVFVNTSSESESTVFIWTLVTVCLVFSFNHCLSVTTHYLYANPPTVEPVL